MGGMFKLQFDWYIVMASGIARGHVCTMVVVTAEFPKMVANLR